MIDYWTFQTRSKATTTNGLVAKATTTNETTNGIKAKATSTIAFSDLVKYKKGQNLVLFYYLAPLVTPFHIQPLSGLFGVLLIPPPRFHLNAIKLSSLIP